MDIWRWKGSGTGGCWPACVIGSGAAHLALLGLCLLIQPDPERARPSLRAWLVEEVRAPEPVPTIADVRRPPTPTTPTRKKTVAQRPRPKRRTVPARAVHPVPDVPPAPAPSIALPPQPTPAPVLVATPDPPVEEPPAQPKPTMLPPPPAPAPPTAADLPAARFEAVGVTPASAALGSAASGRESPGSGDEKGPSGTGGGSGASGSSPSAVSEPRGAFWLAGQGNGVGIGGGSGVGAGGGAANGLRPGSGTGRREAVGGSEAGGNGHTARPRGGNRAASDGQHGDQLLRTIRRQIARVWTYPDAARRDGLEGRVELRFRVAADGSAETVEILKSSGHTVLDDDLVRTVHRAGPYPVFAGWVRLPFTYRLAQ